MDTTKLRDGEIIKCGDIWAAYKGQSPNDSEMMQVYFSMNTALGTIRPNEHDLPKGLGWEQSCLRDRDIHFRPALDKHGYVWTVTKKLIKFHG